ncbi:MAG: hypothetical protein K2N32_05035, partial [Clostridia bacterium]|nr:hypothetical protein [Clostridia bacterium]
SRGLGDVYKIHVIRLDVKNQERDVDKRVFDFLDACQNFDKYVTMTNVLVPSLNDTYEKLNALKELKNTYTCIKEVKFLAFRKLCESKYERLNLPFTYEKYEEGSKSDLEKAYEYINS